MPTKFLLLKTMKLEPLPTSLETGAPMTAMPEGTVDHQDSISNLNECCKSK